MKGGNRARLFAQFRRPCGDAPGRQVGRDLRTRRFCGGQRDLPLPAFLNDQGGNDGFTQPFFVAV